MKVGKVVTKTKLHKEYWYGVSVELTRLGYVFRPKSRVKGAVAKYHVQKDLPSAVDLQKEVDSKLHTKSVGSWYEDAKSDLERLRDEMNEWRDAMECSEGLQATEKYSQVEEAVDILENGELPDEVPESIEPSLIFITPSAFPVSCGYRTRRPQTGRAARCGEICSILEAVKDRAQEEIDNLDNIVKDAVEGDLHTEHYREIEAKATALEEFIGEVESVYDEIGNVEFPGMYG